MKEKKCMSRADQLSYWIQQYLQAKTEGNTKLIRIYEALIVKLGGKIPKF